MDKQQYTSYAEGRAKKSKLPLDCFKAFAIGGLICAFGRLLGDIYHLAGMSEGDASCMVSVTLVFLAALLTGLGVFDRIAKHAGAGTLVPITGFANAIASEAIDSKSEGFVLGLGAKIFTVAGPVILYGVVASVIYGVVFWICGMFG